MPILLDPALGNEPSHGAPDPHAAKPDDKAKAPLPVPLPPRPTEYPKGITIKAKPGQPDPAAPKAQKPVAADPHAPSPPADHGPAKPADHGTAQEMPAPIEAAKPADAHPTAPTEAAKPVSAPMPTWTPPKRYHFISDTYSGLAIGGVDPVSFFIDDEPRAGGRGHELDWGGTTWQFVNEGNLAAFKDHPEIYAPQFGGHCAYSLTQNLSVEGYPQFFVVHRDRLYLFANAGHRAAFLTNPDALAREAERLWPALARTQP